MQGYYNVWATLIFFSEIRREYLKIEPYQIYQIICIQEPYKSVTTMMLPLRKMFAKFNQSWYVHNYYSTTVA